MITRVHSNSRRVYINLTRKKYFKIPRLVGNNLNSFLNASSTLVRSLMIIFIDKKHK